MVLGNLLARRRILLLDHLPWIFAYFMTNDLFGVLHQQTMDTLGWTYLFGMLWGFGGLTYGLTMRYLGLSLGTGVALGYCAAFGTMVPPIFKALTPNFFVFAGSPSIITIAESTSGKITLAGVVVCLLGITIAAMAGYTKESEMPAEKKKEAIKEFSFKKGILVATFCGIMSACFAFGLQAGKDINAASELAGTNHIWTGLPTLPVLLLGGSPPTSSGASSSTSKTAPATNTSPPTSARNTPTRRRRQHRARPRPKSRPRQRRS